MELTTDPDVALLSHLCHDLFFRHGKGFRRSNLVRFQQIYLASPICATLSHELSNTVIMVERIQVAC